MVLLSGEPGIGKSRHRPRPARAAARRGPRQPPLPLLAVPREQRALPCRRAARAGGGLRPRRRRRGQARQARGAARPRGRRRGRGRPLLRRAPLAADRGPLRAAAPDAAGEEGPHLPGAPRPARGAGGAKPGADGARGRALDRSDHARAVRPRGAAHGAPAGAAGRDLPARVQAALGMATRTPRRSPSTGSAGPPREAIVDRLAAGKRPPEPLLRRDRREGRRGAAVRRGAHQGRARIRPAAGDRGRLRARRPAAAPRDPGDAPGLR